jgi:uncharacterized protein (TIGR02246 family)
MPRHKGPVPPPPASPDEIEQQFYEALQRADLEQLMAVWSDDDDIVCVHPGGPRVVGPAAIRSTFEQIFANGAIVAAPEKVRRLQTLDCAVHSVLERIDVLTDEGPRAAWVLATNVYVKTGLGWRMAAHHASPGTSNDVQEIVETASTLH